MATVYAEILDDDNEEQEGHAHTIHLDDNNDPINVWIKPTKDSTILNVCTECSGEYGDGKYQKCCTEIFIYDNNSLINLYNALHEALIERNLEVPPNTVKVILAEDTEEIP